MAGKTHENQMGFMQHWKEKNLVKSWIDQETHSLPGVYHCAWNGTLVGEVSQRQISLLHGHLFTQLEKTKKRIKKVTDKSCRLELLKTHITSGLSWPEGRCVK